MHIEFIEVVNFRKLLGVRIDIAETSTVFVGANNSGKTSAMVALRLFLVDESKFSLNDFTLTHWPILDALGKTWEEEKEGETATEFNWGEVAPCLDVWLKVPDDQLHYVQKILPTLDWDGSAIGVRLRFEPKKVDDLKREYLAARVAATSVMTTANKEWADDKFSLWPKSMIEFLSRRLRATFEVKAYLLDPVKLEDPHDGNARPQDLPEGSEPIVGDPFKGLIRIDEISAQRGLGWTASSNSGKEDGSEATVRVGNRLSTQLRNYYSQHLDPFDQPEPKDIEALQALHGAREEFGKRLATSFESALKELETIGYPGVSDPKLTLAADVRPLDVLNHGSSVQYEVPTHLADIGFINRLPEDSNGLGYQNLVSIVFALMSFRDKWMRVGKASKKVTVVDAMVPPLHLVLIEEPEAHLHAQVQQVFIAHAYKVLRKHVDLGAADSFRTQMIISTHSSHLAHEAEFASLRYFRRMPVKAVKGSVPVSHVVNLSQIFGTGDETTRFVKRYLKVTHCDLFFADGAILVEGPAERIVVPHMLRNREAYEYLRRCYLTWLEIGGSHAHRLRSLLEKLGLNTLIITDIDAKNATNQSVCPARGVGLLSRNQTLKTWIPAQESLDTLLDAIPPELASLDPCGFGIRVAYQQPVEVFFKSGQKVEALANTFEDALVYQNLALFEGMHGGGLVGRLRDAIGSATDIPDLAKKIREALDKGGKAEFAMNLLESDQIDQLVLPDYIDRGLHWLAEQLKRKEDDVAGKLPVNADPVSSAADASAGGPGVMA